MRKKLMITVSDVHGSKQYTVHELIRRLVLWIVISIVVLFTIGVILIKALSSKVDTLDQLTLDLKNQQQSLVIENKELQNTKINLTYEKNLLRQNINKKSQQLESMNEQLEEIEDIIGIEPNINNAFEDRAEAAKLQSIQNIQAASLNITELSILNKSIPTGSPLKTYKRISDGFGYRTHPITHKRVFHFGLDYAANTGTPIYATADGVVTYAKKKGGYGNFLLISHHYGFSTAYGHLHRYAALEGDYVYKGDIIGYVGNTGKSTGPHLHYEIRYLHKWLNPASFTHWNKDNYKNIMKKERLVKWDNLLQQLHRRLSQI